LRSSLAKYFLLIRVWKMLCDRNALHLVDLEDLPFHRPEDAADPERATQTIAAIAQRMQEWRMLGREARAQAYEAARSELDDLVFDYFDLAPSERRRVRESVQLLLPSVRPRAFKSLDTPAQKRARREDLERYARALGEALEEWRVALGGAGHFAVSVQATDPQRSGAMGAVRVEISTDRDGAPEAIVQIENAGVYATLRQLSKDLLTEQVAGELVQLTPDTLFWTATAVYLVRPLIRRTWMERTAYKDAERIVRDIHAQQPAVKTGYAA
jgi:hypothetical protein